MDNKNANTNTGKNTRKVNEGEGNQPPKKGDMIVDYFENHFAPARNLFIPYAPEVYLISKIGGINEAKKYLSMKFNRKISTKPIWDLLQKIKSGAIKLTEDDVRNVAKRHPLAEQFLSLNPKAANPNAPENYIEEEEIFEKQAKRASKKKVKAAEKVSTLEGKVYDPERKVSTSEIKNGNSEEKNHENLEKINEDGSSFEKNYHQNNNENFQNREESK